MKILKLQFKNINSLKGEHTINFEEAPFDKSTLFLISGPTGSGKSSILDAISLALFNKIPRFSSAISNNEIIKHGSVVTKFEDIAYSTVEYESEGKRYTSKWLIEKNRNDNWRQYSMEIFDHQIGKLLDLSLKEVPAKNEEQIGLTYDQFLKSILLSQGAFDQFLKANKSERGALLEKITGTEIYRKIGALAYDNYVQLKNEIDQEKSLLDTIEVIPDVEKVQIQKEIQLGKDNLVRLQNQIDTLTSQINTKNSINITKKRIDDYILEHSKIKEEISKFSEKEKLLQKHRSLVKYTKEFSQINTLQSQAKQHINEIGINDTEIKRYESEYTSCLQKMEVLCNVTISDNNFHTEMKKLEEKYFKLSAELSKYEEEGKRIRARINLLIKNDEQLTERIAPDEAISIINSFLASYEDQINKLGVEIELSELYDRCLHERQEKALLQEKIIEKQKLQAEIEKLNGNLIGQSELFSKLNKEKDQEILLRKELEKELDSVQAELLQHQKKVSLNDLRDQLVVGEECPLCGSTDHPFILHNKIFREGELSIRSRGVKQKLEESKQKLSLVEKDFAIAQNKLVSTQAIIKEKTSLILQYGNIDSTLNLGVISEGINKLDKKLLTLKALIKNEKKYEVYKTLGNSYAELGGVYQKYKVLQNDLLAIYSGKENLVDITNSLQDTFNKSKEKLDGLKSRNKLLIEQLNKCENTIVSIEEELLPRLKDLGYDNVFNAYNNILSAELVEKYENEQKLLEISLNENEAKINSERKNLLEFKEHDESKDLETLISEKSQSSLERDLLNESIGKSQQLIIQDEANIAKRNDIEQRIGEKLMEFENVSLLNQIIGDRTGNKFANYAQDLTLKSLISITNRHLQKLNDRYVLKHSDIEDELIVYDTYQGDTERAVTTLSGGETFMLSLAMAVSLSELASKNVQIQSIFIDEGFGTLDAESLEQAMVTLENLQSQTSKTIGIISHVESLKERINTQIQLEKNHRGYSKIRIVS